jgi:hypothetical protein
MSEIKHRKNEYEYLVVIPIVNWTNLEVKRDMQMSKQDLIDSITQDELEESVYDLWQELNDNPLSDIAIVEQIPHNFVDLNHLVKVKRVWE